MVAKQIASKSVKYSNCFDKLDNEGSGFLNLNHLSNLLVNYKEGLFRDQVAEGKKENVLFKFKLVICKRFFLNSGGHQKISDIVKW